MLTYASPAPITTAASASSDAATPTPNRSNRAPARSTPASSSSLSSAVPNASLSPFNAVWPPATRSTITPSTRRAPCSPVHPEYHRVGLLAMFCLPNCDLQTPRAWRRFVPREPPGLEARGYHVRAHSWPGGRQASLSRKRRGVARLAGGGEAALTAAL